ncbi:MAG: hypothetical protein JNL01_15505 [Bdellovibrionales bacterium]|nr:hypothetical protein [Bdellovibrionales bacterium]
MGLSLALVASQGVAMASAKLPKGLKSKRKSSPAGLEAANAEVFQAVQGKGDLSVYEVPKMAPAAAPELPAAPVAEAPNPPTNPIPVPVTATVAAAPAPVKTYDEVPDGLADALEKRLDLVEKLIRDHKRAYDYRSHTVKQLEEILEKLEAETSS